MAMRGSHGNGIARFAT